MKTNDIHFARVVRRIREATGFIELGLPQYALDRLEGLDEPGPFTAQIELVRGEALRRQHRYFDAVASLKRAAAKAPAPIKQSAMLAISACYHQTGDHAKAMDAYASARGVAPKTPGRFPGGLNN
jgi:tetratricopeptide (TPR) repeat protein